MLPDPASAFPSFLAPLDALIALLRGKRLVALTGAGCSTESGIPDYRGPETRRRARNPIQGREFARSAEIRARYWARAVVGWARFSAATPNPGHLALARLERDGALSRQGRRGAASPRRGARRGHTAGALPLELSSR